MPSFPSAEWMDAYAAAVANHDQATALSHKLEGRYRFIVTTAGGFTGNEAHDLVVVGGGSIIATLAEFRQPTVLTVTADYLRWRGLITGTADFVMSFLMRRIRVEGNVMGLRQRINDVSPLLDSLRQVPTTFDY